MISVFKTTLKIEDEQKVPMQRGSRILKVAEQNGKVTLWYLCDCEAELTDETFYVIGTGQQLPDTFPGNYVGSCKCEEFIWHVFFKQKQNVQRGKTIVAEVNPNDDGADVGTRGNGNGA